jgi:hypothetical protein
MADMIEFKKGDRVRFLGRYEGVVAVPPRELRMVVLGGERAFVALDIESAAETVFDEGGDDRPVLYRVMPGCCELIENG